MRLCRCPSCLSDRTYAGLTLALAVAGGAVVSLLILNLGVL